MSACASSHSGGAKRVPQASAPASAANPHQFRNDEDKDATSDGDGDEKTELDTDGDYAEDHPPNPGNNLYHDVDDASALDYGRPASTAQAHVIDAIVHQYTSLASSQRAAAACSLLTPGLARGLAQEYGGANGPVELRGAKTCEAVLTRLFRVAHKQLERPYDITSVRVQGGYAHALGGSTSAPASVVGLVKQEAKWWIATVLPQPLP
jgi:hypothetical protein